MFPFFLAPPLLWRLQRDVITNGTFTRGWTPWINNTPYRTPPMEHPLQDIDTPLQEVLVSNRTCQYPRVCRGRGVSDRGVLHNTRVIVDRTVCLVIL